MQGKYGEAAELFERLVAARANDEGDPIRAAMKQDELLEKLTEKLADATKMAKRSNSYVAVADKIAAQIEEREEQLEQDGEQGGQLNESDEERARIYAVTCIEYSLYAVANTPRARARAVAEDELRRRRSDNSRAYQAGLDKQEERVLDGTNELRFD